MKIVRGLQISLSFIIVLFLFSCDEKQKNPISKYGEELTKIYKRGGKLGEAANLDAVKKAVETYRVTNDKYPQSLDDIRNLLITPVDLSQYDYNPETGSVSLKK